MFVVNIGSRTRSRSPKRSKTHFWR